MSKSLRYSTIVAVSVVCAAAVAAAAVAQAPPPVPVHIVDPNATVDLTAEALKVLGSLATVVVSAIAVEIRSVVKDKAAQQTLIGLLERGSSFVVNKTAGALKNQPLSVNLASPMAADLVRYAKEYAPGALKRLGIDDVQLTKMAIAHLPNVNGGIDDKEINAIAAAATGKAPPAPTDLGAIAAALVPLVKEAIAKDRAAPGPATAA